MNDIEEKNNAPQKAKARQNTLEEITPKKEMLIPIKFNKEIKKITAEEAAELAQKGMKYDIIIKDYEILKGLAQEEGKSVAEFLVKLKSERLESRKKELTEKCGGDKELAEHFLKLEQSKANIEDSGFSELKENFPQIAAMEKLPNEVLEKSRLKGTKLLDEYLRYLLTETRERQKAEAEIKKADKRSLGSLQNKSGTIDPEAAEFLKGLWK